MKNITKLPLNEVWAVYDLLKTSELEVLDVFDAMEEALVELKPILELTDYQAADFNDDTTIAYHMFRMRDSLIDFVSRTESLLEQYIGFGEDDRKELLKSIEPVLVTFALVYYVKFDFSTIVDNLHQTGELDFENGGYSVQVLNIPRDEATSLANTIMKVFITYKPYLPEYFLNDEELGELEATLSETIMSVAEMSPDMIKSRLGWEA